MIDAETLKSIIIAMYIGLCIAVFFDGRLRWRDRAVILIFCGTVVALMIFVLLPPRA